MLARYARLLDTSPYSTRMITSFFLFGTGDALSQLIEASTLYFSFIYRSKGIALDLFFCPSTSSLYLRRISGRSLYDCPIPEGATWPFPRSRHEGGVEEIKFRSVYLCTVLHFSLLRGHESL